MASLNVCGFAAGSRSATSQAVARCRPPNGIILCSSPKRSPQLPRSSLAFGIKCLLRWQIGQRCFVSRATNSDPSDIDSQEEKSGGKTSDVDAAAQGPPFLTILAGFVVFLAVFWIIGSIISWFVGLIVNLASSK